MPPSEVSSETLGRESSGDVSALPREAGDDARGNGVANGRHDNGYRRGRALGHKRPRYRMGHDDVNLEANQLGRQIGEPIALPLRPSVLNDNVLALHVAEVTQARPQCIYPARETGSGLGTQEPNPRDLRRLLRIDGERRYENAQGEDDDNDEPEHAEPNRGLLGSMPRGKRSASAYTSRHPTCYREIAPKRYLMHYIHDLFFSPSNQPLWIAVQAIGAVLAALGTVAAVITALRLAQKDNRVDLSVSAGVRVLVPMGGGQHERYLYVEVVNLGRRVATVDGVYWASWPRWAGWLLRRKIGAWITPQNRFSAGMPVTLKDGEHAVWMMPIADLKTALHQNL